MLNLTSIRTLTNHGYDMPAILAAVHAAETNGSADLDGWTIRYNDRGEMITVHPSLSSFSVFALTISTGVLLSVRIFSRT